MTAGGGGGVYATVGGFGVPMMSGYGGYTNMTGTVIVPPITTYSIGCPSIIHWYELS